MGGYGIAGAGEGAAASLLKLGWIYQASGFYVKEPASLQDALQAVQALSKAGGVSGCHLLAYTERVDLGQALGGQSQDEAPAAAAPSRDAQPPAAFGFGEPYGAQFGTQQAGGPVPEDPLAALLASGMLDEEDDPLPDVREEPDDSDDADDEDAEDALTRAEQEAREEEEYALQMMQEMGLR